MPVLHLILFHSIGYILINLSFNQPFLLKTFIRVFSEYI